MSVLRKRNLRRDNHTWPGFVDALATLLMVVIFVLMIFSLAQFYLNQVVSGQDEALISLNNKLVENENSILNLNQKIIEISDMLLLEKKESKKLSEEIIILKNNIAEGNDQIDLLSQTIASLNNELLKNKEENSLLDSKLIVLKENNDAYKNEIKTKDLEIQNIISSNKKIVDDFNNKIKLNKDDIALKLNDIIQLKAIKEKLEDEITQNLIKTKEINSKYLKERDYNKSLLDEFADFENQTLLAQKELKIKSEELINQNILINNLSNSLAQVKLKLSQLQALFDKNKLNNEAENIAVNSIGNNLNTALVDRVQELQRFRSEFFGRLSSLLQDRDEIQIVGDRFVFQSEVLFEPASAKIGKDGQNQITKLSLSLKEISKAIPEDINWVLQVEGHTDKTPLRPGVFKDNWDLSTERALSVVRLLINNGIDPKRLSASGYGEFHPLNQKDEISLSKNRRIELKLTQRIE